MSNCRLLISMLKGEKDESESQTDVRDYDGGSTEAPESSSDEEDSQDEEPESFETQEFTEDRNS